MKDLYQRIETYNIAGMKPSRVEHTRRVTEMAILLAEQYGVDYHQAKLAALLHDIAKPMNKKETLDMLKAHGIDDPYLSREIHLAHGELGAIIARENFGVEDEDVLNAVRYHTYGRRGMSLLEKIIFIADYVEEGRDFEGVVEARKLAKQNLSKAVVFATEQTILFLLKHQGVIHPNALEVRNEWLENGGTFDGNI